MVKDMEIYYANNTLYIELIGTLKMEEKEYLKKRIAAIVRDYDVNQIIFESNNTFLSNRHFLKELKHICESKTRIR